MVAGSLSWDAVSAFNRISQVLLGLGMWMIVWQLRIWRLVARSTAILVDHNGTFGRWRGSPLIGHAAIAVRSARAGSCVWMSRIERNVLRILVGTVTARTATFEVGQAATHICERQQVVLRYPSSWIT